MTAHTNLEDLEEWEVKLLNDLKKVYRRKKPQIHCCENGNCNCEALLFFKDFDESRTFDGTIQSSTKD